MFSLSGNLSAPARRPNSLSGHHPRGSDAGWAGRRRCRRPRCVWTTHPAHTHTHAHLRREREPGRRGNGHLHAGVTVVLIDRISFPLKLRRLCTRNRCQDCRSQPGSLTIPNLQHEPRREVAMDGRMLSSLRLRLAVAWEPNAVDVFRVSYRLRHSPWHSLASRRVLASCAHQMRFTAQPGHCASSVDS